MRTKQLIWIFALIFSIATGLFIALSSIFLFIFYILFVVFIFISLAILGIANANASDSGNFFFKIILVSTLVSLVTTITFYQIKLKYLEVQAEEIISNIENEKDKNGTYPIELPNSVNNSKLVKFNYDVDSSRQNYSLRYTFDGWNIKDYDSKTKEWIITD